MGASASARLVLALLRMEGVGRVTAGRLAAHFASYADLRRYPREQVLARIKGAPRAADLVGRLMDPAEMQPHLDAADAQLQQLARQRVRLLTPSDAGWPGRLEALPRAQRPVLLYVYGDAAALRLPSVALFARPPLRDDAFEQAQHLARHLKTHHLPPVTSAAHGFDIVITKIMATGASSAPSVLVCAAGMGVLPPSMRPTASLAARSGGALLSPFPMQHGPYDHDDKERSLLQAALSRACVFVEPHPQSPEWLALTWALEAGRPVFGIPAPDTPLPDRVHPLNSPVDFDWVVAAAAEPS